MKVTQYMVRSNVHIMNLDTAINRLLNTERFIDVTLSCDGQKFRCHRLVLAASSPLFEELLLENPANHPIVILPVGIKSYTLKSLIDFIYKGETNVSPTELHDLVESAKILQVTGLLDSQTQFWEHYEDAPIQEDEIEIHENQTEINRNEYRSYVCKVNQSEQIQQKKIPETENQPQEILQEGLETDAASTPGSVQMERIIDFIEIDDSQDTVQMDEGFNEVEKHETSNNSEAVSKNMCSAGSHKHSTGRNSTVEITVDNTGITQNESCKIEELISLRTSDVETQRNVNGNDSNDTGSSGNINSNVKAKVNSIINKKGKTEDIRNVNNAPKPQNVPNGVATTFPTIRVKPTIKLINLFQLTGTPGKSSQLAPSQTQVPWTYLHIPASEEQANNRIQSPWTLSQLPKENAVQAKAFDSHTFETNKTSPTIATVPSFLKFNSKSMAISVKQQDQAERQDRLEDVSMATEEEPEAKAKTLEITLERQNSGRQNEIKTENNPPEVREIELGETKISEADFPMFYAMMKKEKEEKAAILLTEMTEADNEAENIVCQPNFSYIYGCEDDGKNTECDDKETGLCIDYDRLMAETYGNEEEEIKAKKIVTSKKSQKKKQPKAKKVEEPLSTFFSPELLPVCKCHRLEHSSTLPLLGPKHFCYHHKLNKDESGKIYFGKHRSVFNTITNSSPSDERQHEPQTVILRNPRCNQPRHYSTDSLYNALMAVKFGESIYRASRFHQVPRKTLRNWMKRWGIKSQYPMPKQLKDAAKKKKLSQTTT